jgi:hypothetical protein
MSEPEPEPDPFPWLPLAAAMAWLKIADGDPRTAVIDDCRKAACDWIEDQRKDLYVVTLDEDDEEVVTFAATWRQRQAGKLATARLVARADSPNGVVAFQELGAGSLLAQDPDVRRLVGRPRPVFG